MNDYLKPIFRQKNKGSIITRDMFLKRRSSPCFSARPYRYFDPKCYVIFFIKENKAYQASQSITYVFIISPMLLCISCRSLICLEHSSKHDKLHQGLDYIAYLRYGIDFEYFMSFYLEEIFVLSYIVLSIHAYSILHRNDVVPDRIFNQ